MRLPRKLILLLTLWAYAVQAIAGVAVAGCLHEGEAGVVAPAPMNQAQMDHSQMNHAQHRAAPGDSADQPATAAADCCTHCADHDCSCGSHGCASAQSGVLPVAAPLTANDVGAIPAARPLDARLRQAHSPGLMRPPAVS